MPQHQLPGWRAHVPDPVYESPSRPIYLSWAGHRLVVLPEGDGTTAQTFQY